MVKRVSRAAAILSIMLIVQACGHTHITNVPPGVSDKEVAIWYEATGATRIWGDTSLDLTKSAISLHKLFPSEDFYQKTLAALGKENQIGIQAAQFLKASPEHFDSGSQDRLAGYLDQGLASIDDATQVGALQIKDDATKSAINASITALRSALRTIFALVKPAGTPIPDSIKEGR